MKGKGAYAWDKNTSARLCAKNEGGGRCARGGVFAGHYIIYLIEDTVSAISSVQGTNCSADLRRKKKQTNVCYEVNIEEKKPASH